MYLSSHSACGWLLDIYLSAALWQLLMQKEKNITISLHDFILGLCLPAPASLEHPVRGEFQVLTGPMVGVQVHVGLCKQTCSCGKCAKQSASAFDFSSQFKMNHRLVGLQERGDHWRTGSSALALLPGLGFWRWSHVKIFKSCQAPLLHFTIGYVTDPSTFWWVFQDQLWSHSAARVSSLLAKTCALGEPGQNLVLSLCGSAMHNGPELSIANKYWLLSSCVCSCRMVLDCIQAPWDCGDSFRGGGQGVRWATVAVGGVLKT